MGPYQKNLASVYDALLGNAFFPIARRNFEWLVKRYSLYFQSAADVACGTGHFVQYLCTWGIPVIGVDYSPAMLAVARKRGRNGCATFLQQDMRKLKLPYKVDIMTCNFDSLNHLLTYADLFRTFQQFSKNLHSNGSVIFDLITNAWKRPGGLQNVLHVKAPEARSTWNIYWHPHKKIRTVLISHNVKAKDGRIVRLQECHREKGYAIPAVRRLLRKSGFDALCILDVKTLHPAGKNTVRALFLAQKT
ncbi:MAG: class I SAM-dependent DNA methyltransferase [bacterium]